MKKETTTLWIACLLTIVTITPTAWTQDSPDDPFTPKQKENQAPADRFPEPNSAISDPTLLDFVKPPAVPVEREQFAPSKQLAPSQSYGGVRDRFKTDSRDDRVPSINSGNSNAKRRNDDFARESELYMGQQPRKMRSRIVPRTVYQSITEPIPADELKAAQRMQKAIEALKMGDEKARSAAADIVQEELRKEFERDLKKREDELAKVEERVKKLREQLNKRKDAQDDIITLRLQTLVNDANGLGFPNTNPGFGNPALVPSQNNPFGSDFGAERF